MAAINGHTYQAGRTQSQQFVVVAAVDAVVASAIEKLLAAVVFFGLFCTKLYSLCAVCTREFCISNKKEINCFFLLLTWRIVVVDLPCRTLTLTPTRSLTKR